MLAEQRETQGDRNRETWKEREREAIWGASEWKESGQEKDRRGGRERTVNIFRERERITVFSSQTRWVSRSPALLAENQPWEENDTSRASQHKYWI